MSAGLTPKDAHHLACHFITCEDPLAKRAQRLNIEMKVINPIDYIRREVK
jgi:hypothetical protein